MQKSMRLKYKPASDPLHCEDLVQASPPRAIRLTAFGASGTGPIQSSHHTRADVMQDSFTTVLQCIQVDGNAPERKSSGKTHIASRDEGKIRGAWRFVGRTLAFIASLTLLAAAVSWSSASCSPDSVPPDAPQSFG